MCAFPLSIIIIYSKLDNIKDGLDGTMMISNNIYIYTCPMLGEVFPSCPTLAVGPQVVKYPQRQFFLER